MGIVAYAVSTGFPILLIAFAGDRITSGLPHVFSLADFVGWRFGPIAKTVVVIIALFNMCIVLLAEYTTIGSIFKDFVGTVDWAIILVVALVTMGYTAYGGLVVSIATDQVQGIASALLMVVISAYIGAAHRCGAAAAGRGGGRRPLWQNAAGCRLHSCHVCWRPAKRSSIAMQPCSKPRSPAGAAFAC